MGESSGQGEHITIRLSPEPEGSGDIFEGAAQGKFPCHQEETVQTFKVSEDLEGLTSFRGEHTMLHHQPTRQSKKTKYSKKTVKYTEAHRERRLLLSRDTPKINSRDSQFLSFEMTFTARGTAK